MGLLHERINKELRNEPCLLMHDDGIGSPSKSIYEKKPRKYYGGKNEM
jgi:hypothetical protein